MIAVDGLDGCGKDAHARRIRQLLEARGHEVVLVSHPSQRFFGRLSKKALEKSGGAARLFATLFFTADVLMSVRAYKARKGKGTTIYVRYLLGTAYLPAKIAPIGYKLFRKLLPFPDLAIFIDIEPSVALRRIAGRGHRREMFETLERLAAVRHVARQLASDGWIVIDNTAEGEGPFQEVERVLRQKSLL